MSNYALTLLNGPEGSNSTVARNLNAVGQVVGSAWIEGAVWNDQGHRALLWNNDGSMIDLGTLGGLYSSAQAINNLGQIVGSTTGPDNSALGFLINPEDTDGNGAPDRWFRDFNSDGANDLMVELPLSPVDINNGGEVVGSNLFWTPATPNGTTGSLTDLGFSAAALNDSAQIVGSFPIDGTSHAILWQSGITTDLGEGSASAINAAGQITVNSFLSAQGLLWTPTTPNGTTGTFTGLPDEYVGQQQGYFAYSEFLGVNNAGEVVGFWGYDAGEGGINQYAIRWTGGPPQDLRELVVPMPSEDLISAKAVNDAGQIVGYTGVGWFPSGSYNRAFLLTPPTNVPQVTIRDVTVVEGNTGTRAATFTVTLSAASSQPVTVAYATADGSATAISDYQASSGTLTIPAGQTTGTITVLINGDRLVEPNKTFIVNLSGATNATIADGQGIGTIVDNEPRISISDVTKAEGKRGQANLFTFTVTLSAAYDQAVTMSYRTVNGTATTGDSDYVAKTGTLTFAPGETTKTITVEVKGDSKGEANETFSLELFGASSNALLVDAFGLGTILNDD